MAIYSAATTLDKVFVGGDFANRTADAISAIEDGHHAARGINRFLNPEIYIKAEQKNAQQSNEQAGENK